MEINKYVYSLFNSKLNKSIIFMLLQWLKTNVHKGVTASYFVSIKNRHYTNCTFTSLSYSYSKALCHLWANFERSMTIIQQECERKCNDRIETIQFGWLTWSSRQWWEVSEHPVSGCGLSCTEGLCIQPCSPTGAATKSVFALVTCIVHKEGDWMSKLAHKGNETKMVQRLQQEVTFPFVRN